MESSTKILRALLDERGVKWDYGITGATTTRFNANGVDLTFTPMRGGLVCSTILTPEQAIAATLGASDAKPTQAESSGTCRNVAVPDEYSDRPFTCSECGARGPMGNGTYHLASSWAMEDGTHVFADSWPVWKYCPNCGRKVIEPTTNDVAAEVSE